MDFPIIPFPTILLPHAPGLLLEDVLSDDQTLRIVLRSTAPAALCPLCQYPTTRIHSHYTRCPADLPWAGHAVRFVRHVRKFFCLTPTCPRHIFTERLPDVVASSARTTVRLTALLRAIAYALGGEAGARLAHQIGIAASPTQLISLIRCAPVPLSPSPRILGVDDWAQRKGIRYGTALYTLIRERHAKGEYRTTIARDLRINYKTARNYALADECPMMKVYPPRPRLPTPYEPFLRSRWAEGCRNGKQLHREIVAHGFRGSRPLVSTFVALLRRAERAGMPVAPIARVGDPLTPHTAAMLLLRRPERCSDGERVAIAQLSACHPDIATTIAFTERFVAIVRERRGAELSSWLADAQASGIREIGQFAVKIRQDEAAVSAGCTLRWSNGQTEGQVTRLKLLKRQMYGRAKFDLLRQRALAA